VALVALPLSESLSSSLPQAVNTDEIIAQHVTAAKVIKSLFIFIDLINTYLGQIWGVELVIRTSGEYVVLFRLIAQR
jgi:hypothetical protein